MANQLSKWRSKSKSCFKTLVVTGKGIEKLKIYFDVLVIIVMVWAIFVSRDSNRIARESLQKSDTPWLKITSIGVDELQIRYILVNFSDSPAVDLQIDLTLEGEGTENIINAGNTYTTDVMMPHDSGNFNFRFSNINWPDFKKQIDAGKISLLFRIKYRSTQGQEMLVEQKVRWIEDGFKDIKYQSHF